MRKSKRRIFILIILLLFIIFEIIAFQNSRAANIIQVTASIIDSERNLEAQTISLESINSGSSGYYITLPEYIDNKKITEYIIEEKNINTSEQEKIVENKEATNIVNNESENILENEETNIINNNIENKVAENTTNTENAITDEIETVQEQEILETTIEAGGRLYLTDEEKESKQITLNAVYSTFNSQDITLYEQILEQTIDSDGDGVEDNNIKIEGYMPLNSTIQANIVTIDDVEESIKDLLNEKTSFKEAYDIKILYNDVEYEPTDFDVNVKVTIGVDQLNESNQKYKVVHINDNNEVEEIKGVKAEENEISFPASSFSTYALLAETDVATYSADLSTANIWDGEVASNFRFGNGTEQNPYLISSGAELAYLAQQVNNGNSYDGNYFKLITDINLNALEWTPIGTYNQPFQGIFDGDGHTIANSTISLPSSLPTTVTSYGLFGSLGDGNNIAIVKNLQLDNIIIELNASGNISNSSTAKGYNIGIVTGTMFNNSQIKNVIVNNGQIYDNYTITIRNNATQIFVGGIAGLAVNSRNSTTDPGANSRYAIENCYSNLDIDLDIALRNSRISYAAQYATGGIIGAIRAQPVWPSNCLFTGTINATNAFTGPIFAYLRDNTGLGNTYSYATQFNTLWQGNDAGNLNMDSYYTSYSTNNVSFTANVTSGTSSSRVSTRNNRIGYYQGVNKGLYTNNQSTMLSRFNNYVTENSTEEYLTWYYNSSSSSFYFTPVLTADVQKDVPQYTILVNDSEQTGNYTYSWYINGTLNQDITGNKATINSSWTDTYIVEVLVSNGKSYAMVYFEIPVFEIHISFEYNQRTDTLTANLEGTGLSDPNFNLNDYSYEWYKCDIAESEELIEGAVTNNITNLDTSMDYKVIATNKNYPYMSAEGLYQYAQRNVIFVDENDGSDYNDGYTPETAVETMAEAYSRFDSDTTRDENIIVLIGEYTDTSFLDTENSSTYRKNVTITGKYKGTDYNAELDFEAYENGYKYLNGNTTFMYLTFDGSTRSFWGSSNSQTYFYLQGYSLTMGEGIHLTGYATSNTNQGLIEGNSPAFHIIAGWLRYNYARLPRNNPKILIKSGTYGRIILGGSPGTTGSSNLQMTTSHNFTGSSMDDCFNIEVTVDIKNSTTPSNYTYDINLLVGGAACGNTYAQVTENIISGSIGRVLGASIGDSSDRPRNWDYPINTFLGSTTVNISGGTITEVYGGCLGRNMNALTGSSSIVCDSYFYGTININISGGSITRTIYGAGAGGVTGYSPNSSDEYKSYGEPFDTVVNINITGGTIDADIYGGGYGYTEYLTTSTIPTDGGSLYGTSNINISGSPVINGDIYAGGRGYNLRSKPDLAQMEGNSNITIEGTPTINGNIYGAGMGISGYNNMAKLTGTTTITINANISNNVFGGGNIALTSGNTNIYIKGGNSTATIYGGGNVGEVEGNSNIYIQGGTSKTVFGGGNQAGVNNTYIYVTGGETEEIYGGSNQSGDVTVSEISLTGGSVTNVYGGNNEGGTCSKTNVTIDGSTINEAVYGGGNQVSTENTEVYLKSSGNNIPLIFGGGKSADATNTHVYVTGGTAQKIFGGSNTSGTVNESYLETTGGTIENIYGGNNAGGRTENSNVNINGGTITNVFGGGDQADTNQSNITTTNGKVTNIYGGANQANVPTTNVLINGGEIESVYGGSNQSGTVTTSNVNINGQKAGTVYGGNNLGGTNITSNVLVGENGLATDVYGGGNRAVTNTPSVIINGTVENSVYGGGNAAGIETDTNVEIVNANISGNVYGGGNEGTVTGNTYVHVKDSTLGNSLYAGGNGTTAIVYGNTNVTVEGTNTRISQSVFGGGNHATTGTEDTNNSTSTVNITSGNIGKNVYGGANTSVVYGVTNTNIGYEAVGDNSLTAGDIEIGGTVFGGGEANAEGSEIYDFSFISVTVGINMNINGTGHDKCQIKGSIFGSGNASSTSGYSYINIKNYGSVYEPQSNISIQRANIVTLDNSAMALSGATDRTNEYSDEFFTLSRIDELKLKNGSILYLNYGANLLQKFTSCVDIDGQEVKAQVTIDEQGNTTRNVDNRIYMLEGKNLNIATNEQVTAFGEVNGMTFFGLFTNTLNPATSTGLYNREYNNGDQITNAGTFSSNSYVRGLHKTDHDITVDGFYSNFEETENPGYIKTKYIETTPPDDVYYIWLVGVDMDVTTFEITLTASKYATLGTYELSLMGFSNPNIKFVLTGFSSGLANGVSLVDPDNIESVSLDENIANTVFGLEMETGKSGWNSVGTTYFLTENGGLYRGTNTYNSDNSSSTPSLIFYLYHSENLSIEQTLGSARVRLQAQIPIDDLNVRIAYIDINITMTTALYQDDYYEAAITPGEEFDLFTTTETNITDSSVFSVYYSLYIPEFSTTEYYETYEQDKHAIVSRKQTGEIYLFPENTKITMIDKVTNKYYYYVVTKQDYDSGKYIYNLSEFVAMGSDTAYYDEASSVEQYYNEEQDLVYENFIFHVDFSGTNIENDVFNNTLLMELRNNEGQTLLGVLGIQRDSLIYSIYKDRDATIEVNAQLDKNIVYLGNQFTLTITTDFTQDIIDSKIIYDTQYFDDKMGVKLTVYDNNGNKLNGDSLLGVSFELDGIKYYPRMDGSIRIKTADKVSNVLSRIIVDTANNTVLATGDYTIQIESFGSPDGIYYGITSSDTTTVKITIIESSYGLNVHTNDEAKIIEQSTGYTQAGNDIVTTDIEYSSGLDNPKITVSLYRRNYDTIYNNLYQQVNLQEYVTNTLEQTDIQNEYLFTDSPKEKMQFTFNLKPNLVTGTYKLVFSLYDNEEYIGQVYEYLIIK